MSQPLQNDAKSKPLYGMFNAIPQHYDLVNRLISWGLDRRWRKLAAHACLATGPRRVLDLGSGTGDMAIAIAQLAKNYASVIGFDYSPAMLEIATKKAEAASVRSKVTFMQGEAASLPFTNEYFDSISISFAFRNLTYKNPIVQFHLAEMYRVLSPGGRLVIIESSQPRSKTIRWLFHLYLKTYVYLIGWWLSGNKGAYRYLTESMSRFDGPEVVKNKLKATGFRDVTYKLLLYGAAAIHIAIK